ncbi:MAG: tRNA guanosine(34) transglycosylase Tgt [bacterium]|nr:tRNA guanosine(34) transglycosylase Tgt [bacterium]
MSLDENNSQPFRFELLTGEKVSSRRGRLYTPHGIIETPTFWPVGTIGAVKLLTPWQLLATNAQGMLSNTYHLMLRPGTKALIELGGLHRWGCWQKPLLTDSGGFQVMSHAPRRKLSEDGVTFQSHLNGDTFHLTPEESIGIQRAIGADIIFMLDVCPPFGAPEIEMREAHERTLRWASRNRQAFRDLPPLYGNEQTLWPVVQGGTDLTLRKESAEALSEGNDFGYAVGGLAVGEPKELMWPATAAVTETLPVHAPKHLLGVGTPEDLLDAIVLGIDSFDCVLPTRNARHGIAFTSHGIVRIKNEKYKLDELPLDPTCKCDVCNGETGGISRSLLRHLYFAAEPNAQALLTYHNVTYYHRLLSDARSAIEQNRYPSFVAETKARWREL